MSWQVMICKFSRNYRDVKEIPQNEVFHALGLRIFLRERILAIFPGTDWSDPDFGVWRSQDGSIEFNLGRRDEPLTSLMLYVRANTNVVPLIVALCLDNGWQGIDISAGCFLEQSSDPTKGLVSWTGYRNQRVRERGCDA